MKITQKQNGQHLYTGRVEYDEYNNLQSFRELVGGDKTEYKTSFEYDIENKPTKLKYGSETDKLEYTYDEIGRVFRRKTTVGGHAYDTYYFYEPVNDGTATTPLINVISQDHEDFLYEYDSEGSYERSAYS